MWLMTKHGFSSIKGHIARIPDQRHKPYHEVWQLLADALGHHGHKPPARRASP